MKKQLEDADHFLLAGDDVVELVERRLRGDAVELVDEPSRDEVGVAIHGSLVLELIWTIIPSVILVVIAVVGFVQEVGAAR